MSETPDDQLQAIRRERFADKKETSGRIGETSRFIGFGLVALVFTIHGSEKQFAMEIRNSYEFMVNLMGLLGCLTILTDYLQFVCGYFSVSDALKRPERSYSYNRKTTAYQGRVVFFWIKQVFALGGGALAVFVIGVTAFSPS